MNNLENMPQLVKEKIISFFNLKQLLTLEQVSRSLKCSVDVHFSITDNLIIGYLPEVNTKSYDKATAKERKCLDGLLKIIKRCGVRLRTIYVFCPLPNGIRNYSIYFQHIFSSEEISENCPNIEKVIAFPKMELYPQIFQQQNILLEVPATEIYANKIKLSKGETCKLRSISLNYTVGTGDLFKRVLNLYSNLEQIAVNGHGDVFVKFLPQLIKNGLKDLHIHRIISIQSATNYFKIGKNLRLLRIGISLRNDNDIKTLNKVQLPKNLELVIRTDDFTQLNENVCSSIIKYEVLGTTVCSSLSKLKRLKHIRICNSVSSVSFLF